MEWPNVVIALVAVYAAALSTYTAIRQWKKEKPQLEVAVKHGVFPQEDSPSTMIFVEARNKGHMDITLVSCGLILPNKKTAVKTGRTHAGEANLPVELTPGKSCRMCFWAKDIADQLKSDGYSGPTELWGFFRDAVDRTYKSKTWGINVDLDFSPFDVNG